MSNQLLTESLRLFSEIVADRSTPLASRVHVSTLTRWATDGARRRRDGKRVKLEARKVGGRWFTSVGAVNRFIADLNDAPGEAVPPVQSPREKQKSDALIDAELDSAW